MVVCFDNAWVGLVPNITVYYIISFNFGRASFTDYSKATRVRMFSTVYTGVVETNYPTPGEIAVSRHGV